MMMFARIILIDSSLSPLSLEELNFLVMYIKGVHHLKVERVGPIEKKIKVREDDEKLCFDVG